VPNEPNTEPTWISNSGLIVGYVFGSGGPTRSFLRDLNGVYSFIDPPDAQGGSVASAVNDNGQVAGTYVDSKDNVHDFFRDSDGTITEFDPPSGNFPRVVNPRINSAGTIVSVYATPEGNLESFLRASSGDFTILNMAGVASTQAEDLNDLGEVVDCGDFVAVLVWYCLPPERQRRLQQYPGPGWNANLWRRRG